MNIVWTRWARSAGDGGVASSAIPIAPIPTTTVACVSVARAMNALALKPASKWVGTPWISPPVSTIMRPPPWNSGSGAYRTSSLVSPSPQAAVAPERA
jgi:hypothetical protein